MAVLLRIIAYTGLVLISVTLVVLIGTWLLFRRDPQTRASIARGWRPTGVNIVFLWIQVMHILLLGFYLAALHYSYSNLALCALMIIVGATGHIVLWSRMFRYRRLAQSDKRG